MASRRIILTMDAGLVAAIDGDRGDVPRAAWIRRAIESRLERGGSGTPAPSRVEAVLPVRRDVDPRFKR